LWKTWYTDISENDSVEIGKALILWIDMTIMPIQFFSCIIT